MWTRAVMWLGIVAAGTYAPTAASADEFTDRRLVVEIIGPDGFKAEGTELPPLFDLSADGAVRNSESHLSSADGITQIVAAKRSPRNKDGQVVILIDVGDPKTPLSVITSVVEAVRAKLLKDGKAKLLFRYRLK